MSTEKEYKELSKQIIKKQEELIALKKILNDADRLYQEKKIISFESWKWKSLKVEVEILEDELTVLRDKRDLL